MPIQSCGQSVSARRGKRYTEIGLLGWSSGSGAAPAPGPGGRGIKIRRVCTGTPVRYEQTGTGTGLYLGHGGGGDEGTLNTLNPKPALVHRCATSKQAQARALPRPQRQWRRGMTSAAWAACGGTCRTRCSPGRCRPGCRGLHSSTFELNLSRVGHTSPYPPV
jgi:hypothetical protein